MHVLLFALPTITKGRNECANAPQLYSDSFDASDLVEYLWMSYDSFESKVRESLGVQYQIPNFNHPVQKRL